MVSGLQSSTGEAPASWLPALPVTVPAIPGREDVANLATVVLQGSFDIVTRLLNNWGLGGGFRTVWRQSAAKLPHQLNTKLSTSSAK